MNTESKFAEIVTDYVDDNDVLHLDGYRHGAEEGSVIAFVFNRQVYYTDPELQFDPLVRVVLEDLKADGLIEPFNQPMP